MSNATTARQRARKLVQGISEKHGYLGEDVLSQMSPSVRRQVEEAMLRKDEMIGSSVVTARFVFELVQNADDNHYETAREDGTPPEVTFHVYPRRIVVDCNEDGFTAENLAAICNVGKSSKTGAQGYIGEKGIGFKSVFMVAWKVHIQSGDFSFSFHHKPGDSGMGMISPVWEEVEEQLERPLTRITLYLHEDVAPREAAMQQFRELQDTLLLFTKNLRRLEVSIFDEDDELLSSTVFAVENEDEENRKVLSKRIVQGGKTEELTRHYHFTKYVAHGLPQSENRKYTEHEEKTRAYGTADVILAFPLTDDSTPVIEQQDVFAFLPIRSMGFTFLIHSDFVTDASRQDIVRSSARNRKLRDAIADAFNVAVSEMCKHPALRYTWVRYLPQRDGHHWDPFWVGLLDGIKTKLLSNPVLLSRSGRSWSPIQEMRRLKWDVVDKSGKPLFPDLPEPEEIYLSPSYDKQDIERLVEYGIKPNTLNDILPRAIRDIRRPDSRMKNKSTDQDWHSCAANVFSRCLVLNVSIAEIKDTPLIPLTTGQWVSIRQRDVYYSFVQGIEIPRDLGLDLVAPEAESNPKRKELFQHLGVQVASVVHVRKLIQDKYKSTKTAGISIAISRSHLVFLYLTETLNSSGAQAINLPLYDSKDRLRYPKAENFYFSNDNPFGAKSLLEPVPGGAPGLDVSFINEHYLHNPPSCPPNEKRTWNEWLQQACQIRNTVSLIKLKASPPNVNLGPECLYIAQHRPERFMGLLAACWSVDGPKIIENPTLLEKLQRIEVLCDNGSRYWLSDTYIPTPARKMVVSKFMGDQFFPWLHLDFPVDEGSLPPEWTALTKDLNFGYPKTQLYFYFHIWRFLSLAIEEGFSDLDRIFDLYVKIQMECHDDPSAADAVRSHIYNWQGSSIWIPQRTYVETEECRWEASCDMKSKYPLKPLFADYCRQNRADAVYLRDFFQKTLNIPNVDAEDLIFELRELQSDECNNFDQISSVYMDLKRMSKQMSPDLTEYVRLMFWDDPLIFVASNWYRVSECLWSTATSISGRIALNDHYHDLREFFVDFLGVQTLTLQMVVEKLRDQSLTGSSSVNDVKDTIWTLNSLLQSEGSDSISPEPILNSAVFPVRFPQGGVQLQTSASAFGIADRKHLFSHFSSKAKLLDFEVDQIPRLEPFLQWTGLKDRYLSCNIKEITMVGGDDATPLSNPDRDIRRKAHGLLRIAVHLKSPRAVQDEDAFYETLKTIAMKETNGISSELHLHQDGTDIKVEISRSELHLDDRDGQLTIYIPRNKRDQDICFLDRIPLALLQWLMLDPLTQIVHDFNESFITTMQTLLQPYNHYVSDLLDRAGIMSIARADGTDATVEEEGRSSHSDQLSSVNSSSSPVEQPILDSNEITPPPSRPRQGSWTTEATVVSASMRSLPAARPSPAVEQNFTDRTTDPDYYQLLTSVLASARSAVFPSQGAFDMTDLDNFIMSTPSPAPIRLRASDQLERDFKIGAAGELFVFELLSRIDPPLPAFTRNNWQSTIRKYVTILPEYSDMTAWHGHETADITYDDHDGMLTSLFIDKGYLREEIWRGKTPRFYMEVKSSTADCRTPFFMSKSQYRRMQQTSNGESQSETTHEVYVIFRVFHLGQQGMKVKVYVDPEMMRVKEELLFTAEG
ncbi:hypothetical protein AbraIFM66950_004548 [Aspergillus brasiliensis]|nr:hypothetical protein AbraIFM66950_004548 [Aspergillus brasiliensis]